MPRLSETLHEAQTNGVPLVCKNCGNHTTARACSVSTDCDEVFCTDGCRDTYEAEFWAYMERAQAQARQAFAARTPDDVARHRAFNSWAAQISAA